MTDLKKRNRTRYLNVFVIGAIVLLLLLGFLWYVAGWYKARVIEDEKARITRITAPYGQELSSQIDRRVSCLAAITAFSASNIDAPDFSQRFDDFAAGLYFDVNGLIAMEVAPDSIIRYIYPLKGNEAAMNLNLLTDPRDYVRLDARDTIAKKAAGLYGPYDLIQGGKGMVAREPIYDDKGDMWGLSTVVMQIKPIFLDAKLHTISNGLVVGITDDQGTLLYGAKSAFSRESISYSIDVPGGEWLFSVMPESGWAALAAPRVRLIWILGLGVVLLIELVVLIALVYRQSLAEAVRIRTIELEAANAEQKAVHRALRQALNDTEARVNERTAELVEANEKLQELDRLKSIFIATMSHELRTPLNSIIGFSSILLNEWVGPLSEEQKQNLATVVRSGQHLLALVNDIIDISKIEAGKIAVTVTPFTMAEAVNEALEMLEREAVDKGLVVKTHVEDMDIANDRRRFLQVLVNLLSNAIKFTERGEIRITAGPSADRKYAQVRVEDTGVGIKKKDIKRLFKPFERIEAPMKEQPPGTGLGLYLSKKIAEAIMYGDITAESDGKTGSVFTMTAIAEREE